jgi:hypothetical protein
MWHLYSIRVVAAFRSSAASILFSMSKTVTAWFRPLFCATVQCMADAATGLTKDLYSARGMRFSSPVALKCQIYVGRNND